jgi:hypothetical protein
MIPSLHRRGVRYRSASGATGVPLDPLKLGVKRVGHAVPPRVEYELTPLGRGLTEPVLGLISWLRANWPVIRSARDRSDARKQVARTVARPGSSTAIRG